MIMELFFNNYQYALNESNTEWEDIEKKGDNEKQGISDFYSEFFNNTSIENDPQIIASIKKSEEGIEQVGQRLDTLENLIQQLNGASTSYGEHEQGHSEELNPSAGQVLQTPTGQDDGDANEEDVH